MDTMEAGIRALDETEINAVAGGLTGNVLNFGFGIKVTVWSNGGGSVQYGDCTTTISPGGEHIAQYCNQTGYVQTIK